MANTDRPRGLKPAGVVLRATEYTASAAVYPGDPVALAATGKIARSAGDALIGVALGYAAADEKVLVADHPDQLFVCQSDTSLADISVVGGNYDITLGTADTTYNVSTAELNGATADAHTTGVDNPLKLLALSPEIGNDWGADCDVVVKINNHKLSGGTGTAAV